MTLTNGHKATKPAIRLEPITKDDLVTVAEGNIAMFESFYEKLEPADRRPPHPVRVQRHARRFERVLESDMTVCTKAVLAEPHGEAPAGELVGIAVWHRPGAPCVNPKRRSVLGDEYHGDAHAWQHVDMDKYEQIWTEWDDMRQSLMAGKDHWYLCPIWVKNEYQGCGIGKLLMQEILDKCDKHSPPTAVYLEATPEGAPLYKKLGFVEVGKSEYVEMARWNKDGRVAP
ncbi:GNAT family acetyltransferase [Rhodotorula taiwanensis]|uniref:GNAT family acetyltransferase n=1 Tax=Rhodotorula taiwanensis TaxID=741276 RepID=A0A2S5BII6_9BASI|nr:GNAT family acetyltransferase [Rhodotorula taiwanensis]